MKKKPNVIGFLNKINAKNLQVSLKYFHAYVDRLKELNFRKNTIYSVKELPYQKNKIKRVMGRMGL